MFYRGSDASSNIVKDALHADLCSETANIKHDTTHSKVSTKMVYTHLQLHLLVEIHWVIF